MKTINLKNGVPDAETNPQGSGNKKMKLGKSIKWLRVNKARRVQSLFAQNIGISQTYLSQIESCKKEPSIKVLQKIASYLEIPLPVLFWFGVEDSDLRPEKAEYFRVLKPAIDSLLKCLF